MKHIDICLVATRRPDLINATLASFCDRLVSHFKLAGIYVNLDPAFGDEADHRTSVRVIREFFPQAQITEPPQAGFCQAVKENWSRSTADYILHLEDDWVLNEVITPSILDRFSDPRVAQVAFLSREKNWNIEERGIAHYRRKKLAVLGIETPIRFKVPGFTTSPSFLRGDFAREVARLYDTRYDPEKQFYKSVNARLEAYVRPFVSEIYGQTGRFVISDIGRPWREARGIHKDNSGARAHWTSAPPQ